MGRGTPIFGDFASDWVCGGRERFERGKDGGENKTQRLILMTASPRPLGMSETRLTSVDIRLAVARGRRLPATPWPDDIIILAPGPRPRLYSHSDGKLLQRPRRTSSQVGRVYLDAKRTKFQLS